MKEKIIRKEDLVNWLDNLIKQYNIFAPIKRNRLVFFERINSGKEMCLDFSNSSKTPKDIFFPQSEVLFTFQSSAKFAEKHPLPVSSQLEEDNKKRILFGIRPCDARSLLTLDKVFNQEDFQDSYYVEKRDNTILIGMGCIHPQGTCFCSCLGGGPFQKDGLDILLIDLGNGKYFLEILTEKGKNLIEGNDSFEDAQQQDTRKLAGIKKKAEDEIKSKVPVEGLKEKLDKLFNSPFWDEIHQRCLGCAICTYLCPTCHCFALLDEKADSGLTRIRNWDSCMFANFTLEASGHNPRLTNKERMRQRIMHKFNYFVGNFGEIACVGCGRCIRNCPVNIDIREIIEEIKSD